MSSALSMANLMKGKSKGDRLRWIQNDIYSDFLKIKE